MVTWKHSGCLRLACFWIYFSNIAYIFNSSLSHLAPKKLKRKKQSALKTCCYSCNFSENQLWRWNGSCVWRGHHISTLWSDYRVKQTLHLESKQCHFWYWRVQCYSDFRYFLSMLFLVFPVHFIGNKPCCCTLASLSRANQEVFYLRNSLQNVLCSVPKAGLIMLVCVPFWVW